jgi:hypothetical protein
VSVLLSDPYNAFIESYDRSGAVRIILSMHAHIVSWQIPKWSSPTTASVAAAKTIVDFSEE